jgi:alkylation response protein AidB-like acyl-CoA dehydrogenase
VSAVAQIPVESLSLEALKARVPAIVEGIRKGAIARDLNRELPFAAFQLIKDAKLGAIRVPRSLGGPGGKPSDFIWLIAKLGEGDSNVAHALRSHFNFTEHLALDPTGAKARAHAELVLQGKLFAGAHTEQGGPKPGEISTRLTKGPNGWRLNGRKWYATGTAFADYASFSAKGDDDKLTGVLVPANRKGITILDDWDGMGQKLTASGGVLLDDVEVFEHEIGGRVMDDLIGRHSSTSRQLHLAASAIGAVRALLDEGIAYVRAQARSAQHSTAPTAREDHFVQKVVGELSARSFALDAVLNESARALDDTAEAFASGDADRLEKALVTSSLATSRTQLVLAELGLKAAEQVFELGGGSATSSKLNLDRHWRNIRTVLNHNPLLHKARVVGDYLVNGTTTHLKEGKVF